MENRQTAPPGEPTTGQGSRSLWFNAPMDDRDRRPQLTRERVVAEALVVIAKEGVEALTMRTLAARLGVVPGALYHHVRNKEQLQDLVLDGVLAEVDFHVDHAQPWTQQIKVLADGLEQTRRSPRRPTLGGRPTSRTSRRRDTDQQTVDGRPGGTS